MHSHLFRPSGLVVLLCSILCLELPAQEALPVQVVKTFKGHTEAIYSVAFSPDGKLAATGSFDKSIKLFDVTTGNEVRTYGGATGHQNLVLSVAFSKDGFSLASGGSDNFARIWDVPASVPVKDFVHAEGVTSLSLPTDGKMVAGGSRDGTVKLWNPADGKQLLNLVGHPGGVTGVAFAPNGQALVSVGGDRTLKFWNPADGKQLGSVVAHAKPITGVGVLPGNNGAFTVGEDGFLKFWQLPTVPAKPLPGHNAPLTAMALSNDGGTVLSASADKAVKLTNVGNGQLLKELTPSPSVVTCLLHGPNATSFGGTADGKLLVWNNNDGKRTASVHAHGGEVTGLALNPNGTQLLSCGSDGIARVWSLPIGVARTIATPERVLSQALSADTKRLVTGGTDKVVRTWTTASGAAERQFAGHTDGVTGIAVTADGNAIVSASADATIRVWNAGNGQQTGQVSAHEGGINDLALSAQNNFLASAGADGSVKIWQFPPIPPKSIAHPDAVTGMALSTDGSRLVTNAGDKQLRVWTLNNFQMERSYSANGPAITAFAVGSDGNLVAIGAADKSLSVQNAGKEVKKLTLPAVPSTIAIAPNGASFVVGLQDNSVKLFDQPEGKELKHLTEHQGAISSVAYSPKGDLFASGSADKTVRLWNAPDGTYQGKIDLPAAVTALAFSKDGSKIGIATAGKLFTLWGVAENKSLLTVAPPAEITGVSFHPEGKQILLGGADNRVRLYGTDGKLQEVFQHDGPVSGVAILPDGKRIASTSADKSARVWTPSFVAQGFHSGPVRRVLITPQGNQIVSAGDDKHVRVLDAKTGVEAKSFAAHDAPITGMTLSADGAKLLTASADKSAKLWTLADGKTALTIPLPGPAQTVALSPNGARIAVAFTDGTVTKLRTYDAANGRELQSVADSATPIRSVQFLPDNRTLVFSGDDKAATIADTNVLAAFPVHTGGATGIFLHPNGTQALSAGKDKTVRLWDLATQKEVKGFGPFPEAVTNLTVSRDFAAFAVGLGKTAKVLQVGDGKELATLNHPAEVTSLGFNADRTRIVTGASDNLTRVWEVSTGRELQAFSEAGAVRSAVFLPNQPAQVLTGADKNLTLQTQTLTRLVAASPSPLRAATITANGSHVLAAGDDHLVRLVNAGSGNEERKCEGATAPLFTVATSKNVQLIASGGADKTVRLYTFNDAKLLGTIPASSAIRGLSFHPTLPLLSGILEDGAVQTWNIAFQPGQPLPAEFGRAVQTFSHTGPGTALAFTDAGSLFSGGSDKTIKQWRIASDGPVKNFQHPNLVDCVAFDKDGTQLATACHDGNLRTWDVPKGAAIKTIPAHIQPQPSAIYGIAWSPDSKQLATAGFDKSSKLYDVASGNLVKEFKGFKEKDFEKGHRDQVFCVALTSNGQLLATGSSDKSIKLWNPADGSVVRELSNPKIKQAAAPEPPLAHPGWVYSLKFTPDDKYLVSVGSAPKNQGYLAVWNVADGTQVFGAELPLGPIYSVAVSPDGSHLLLGCGPKDRRVPACEAVLMKLPK
jgi:WD40 repeat protein